MAVYFSARSRIDYGFFLCHSENPPEPGDEAFNLFFLGFGMSRITGASVAVLNFYIQ